MQICAVLLLTTAHIKGCRKYYRKDYCVPKDVVPLQHQQKALDAGYSFCAPKSDLNWLIEILAKVGGYLSFGGTSMSIVCCLFTIVTFHLFPAKFPFGIFCFCVCFLFSDPLYIIVSGMSTTNSAMSLDLCKGLAVATHFSFIAVQSCYVMCAVDIAVKFGIVCSNQPRSSLGNYVYRRAPVLFAFSEAVVAAAVTCLFNGFYGRLLFYVAANGLSVICTSVFVVFTLSKIKIQNRASEKSFKGSVTTRPLVSVSQISLKLVLAFGLIEMVGFVQLSNVSPTVRVINSGFALLYDFVRSLRGVVIFFTFVGKASGVKLYINRIREVRGGVGRRAGGGCQDVKNGNQKEPVKTTLWLRSRMREASFAHSDDGRVDSKNTTNNEIGNRNPAYIIGRERQFSNFFQQESL